MITRALTSLFVGLLAGAALMCLVTADSAAIAQEEEKEYDYRENLNRLVGVGSSEGIYLGYLDANGNFAPKPGVRPLGAAAAAPAWEELGPFPPSGKPAYEFRSRRLIRGSFDAHGVFVPEIGSEIVSFDKYRYSKNAIPIYNLPGRFVERNRQFKD